MKDKRKEKNLSLVRYLDVSTSRSRSLSRAHSASRFVDVDSYTPRCVSKGQFLITGTKLTKLLISCLNFSRGEEMSPLLESTTKPHHFPASAPSTVSVVYPSRSSFIIVPA